MDAIPEAVHAYLLAHEHGAITATADLGGGCISAAHRLEVSSGARFFLKTNAVVEDGFFAAEAAGLAALAVPGAPAVPRVHLHGEDFILMELIEPGRRAGDYAERFGRQLAVLHDIMGPHFGFTCDTFCGATRQPNRACEDGHAFYAEQRYGHQARLARDGGLIGAREVAEVEAFAARLGELVPAQPPSLLHGDLWVGNAHTTPEGHPALIDPAVYWGWAEAELAMTTLFGGFAPAFYRAYHEARPQIGDWRDRADIHNCYHLFNHANLFGGGGYLSQALGIVRRYA